MNHKLVAASVHSTILSKELSKEVLKPLTQVQMRGVEHYWKPTGSIDIKANQLGTDIELCSQSNGGAGKGGNKRSQEIFLESV